MQCTISNPNIAQLFTYGTCVISKAIIPLLFTLALVLFVWGIVKFFIIDAGEEAKRTQGKQFMVWALIALVVMSSIWGLVRIFGNTLGLNSYTRVLPGVRPPGSSTNTGGGTTTTTTTPTPTTTPFPEPGNECREDFECKLLLDNQSAYCGGGYCVTPL